MTVTNRLARAWVAVRGQVASAKTLNRETACRRCAIPIRRWSGKNENGSRQEPPRVEVLLGVLGGGFLASRLPVAHADNPEGMEVGSATTPLPAASSSSDSSNAKSELEEISKNERQRIEDALKSKGLLPGLYPRFTVSVKGQKVSIKFEIPFGCDMPQLIANLASNLGIKANEVGGSDVSLRAWNSAVAWQLTLSRPAKKNGTDEVQPDDMKSPEDDLCVLLFRSLLTSEKAEIEFMKRGSLNARELDAFVSVLQLAGEGSRTLDRKPVENASRIPAARKSVASSLESMGVRIYGLDKPLGKSTANEISWDNIAGYDQQKREIEDTILLALQSPEVYDDIARGTRQKFESNRPRAVLFEGPPGTGKTSSARVIADQAGIPLLYVPLEVVLSKYYGESERLLGKVFSLANELPEGAIIFLDEVDSFAVARDNEMHEATRRLLSVLLRQVREFLMRAEAALMELHKLFCFINLKLFDLSIKHMPIQIDGFEQDKKVVVIAATNRKQDLDPALISRFDSMIVFGLPDQQTRQEITAQYAKHLTKSELEEFASVTEGMSGRDIRDVCQQAERSWASKIIRGQAARDGVQGCLPPIVEYVVSAMNRQKALSTIQDQKVQGPRQTTRPGYDVV